MEVHHHPDLRKKNFKEYIFEGLMIFMAVTLGFFAERLRENLAEHMKEREFVASMIEDAQTDIATIQKTITKNKMRVLKLETLSSNCFQFNDAGSSEVYLYNVIRDCIRHPDFVCPVERTMIQLKNAGGMRLIQKKLAVDSLVFYDDVTKKLVNQQEYYERQLNVLLDATEEIFNLKCFPLDSPAMKWKASPDSLLSAKLISHDKMKLIEYGNKAKIFQGIVMFYIVRMEETKLHAINLICTLKKEYHLK